MTPRQYDELIVIEFNLENLEDKLKPEDPAKAELRRALRAINRAARLGRPS